MKKKLILPVLLSSALLAGSIPVNVFAKPADSANDHHQQALKEWNENASVPLFVRSDLQQNSLPAALQTR